VRHGTCFRRRLSTHRAGAAPHSAVAELGVVLVHIVHPFANKFRILVRLAKLALVAIPLFVLAAILHSHSPWPQLLVVLAVFSFLPCFIYAYVLTILHWKSRYRGTHSDLWGVLLLLETSGWFKLIYIFRHILPDMKGRGRYSRDDAVD
jgi:hypothetical protein